MPTDEYRAGAIVTGCSALFQKVTVEHPTIASAAPLIGHPPSDRPAAILAAPNARTPSPSGS